jgi:hypothetical protein
VDDIPGIQALPIPEGVFKCTRLGKNPPDENKSSGICKPVIFALPYSPSPSPFQYQNPEGLSSPQDDLEHHISGPQLFPSDLYLHWPSMDPPSFTFSHHKSTNWQSSPCSETPSLSTDAFSSTYQPMQNYLSTPLSLNPGYIPISPSNSSIWSLGPFPIAETPNSIQYPINLSPMASVLGIYPENCTAAQALAPYEPIQHRGPLDENKMTPHTSAASQANHIYFY